MSPTSAGSSFEDGRALQEVGPSAGGDQRPPLPGEAAGPRPRDLLCIQTQTNLEIPSFKFETDEFYFKSPRRWRRFGELKPALLNTRRSPRRPTKLEFASCTCRSSTWPAGKGQGTPAELVETGLGPLPGDGPAGARPREHELSITKTGFTSYFLITWDFVHTRSRRIPGSGRARRGLGGPPPRAVNHDLDPLEHDLIFERFLNPDRISSPISDRLLLRAPRRGDHYVS